MQTSPSNQLMTWLAALGVFATRAGKFLPANISPLGTFGFFGGNPLALLASIIAFDYLVGGFYSGFWVNYLAFMSYPALGWLSRQLPAVKSQPWAQFALLPLASLLFFLISNAGVWWYWYPSTLEGLLTCYTLALPFYARTLMGDVMFGGGWVAWQERAVIYKKIRKLTKITSQAQTSL